MQAAVLVEPDRLETVGVTEPMELYRKELIVASPRSANAEDFPLAIDAVASGHVRIDTLFTHRFPLAEARAAVATAAEPGSLKVLVDV